MKSIFQTLDYKPLFFSPFLALTFLISCSFITANNKLNHSIKSQDKAKNSSHNIPFSIAKNYFVKNTAPKLLNPKIESQTTFDTYFAMAVVMGEDGLPTKIDFNSENVIAIILSPTNQATTLSVVGLQKNKSGNIILTYKVTKGEKQSYTITPFLALIIKKSEKGKVILRAI